MPLQGLVYVEIQHAQRLHFVVRTAMILRDNDSYWSLINASLTRLTAVLER